MRTHKCNYLFPSKNGQFTVPPFRHSVKGSLVIKATEKYNHIFTKHGWFRTMCFATLNGCTNNKVVKSPPIVKTWGQLFPKPDGTLEVIWSNSSLVSGHLHSSLELISSSFFSPLLETQVSR